MSGERSEPKRVGTICVTLLQSLPVLLAPFLPCSVLHRLLLVLEVAHEEEGHDVEKDQREHAQAHRVGLAAKLAVLAVDEPR